MNEKQNKQYQKIKEFLEKRGIKTIPTKTISGDEIITLSGNVFEIDENLEKSIEYFSPEVQLQKVYKVINKKGLFSSDDFIKQPFSLAEFF